MLGTRRLATRIFRQPARFFHAIINRAYRAPSLVLTVAACSGAGGAVFWGAAYCEPTYTIKLTVGELTRLIERYQYQRFAENVVAAVGSSALVVGDMFFLSGTGLVGVLVSGWLCAFYVYRHLEAVQSVNAEYRWRFIDVAPEQMLLMGLLQYHATLQDETILPADHTHTRLCQLVGTIVAQTSGVQLAEGQVVYFLDDLFCPRV